MPACAVSAEDVGAGSSLRAREKPQMLRRLEIDKEGRLGIVHAQYLRGQGKISELQAAGFRVNNCFNNKKAGYGAGRWSSS